MDAKFIKLTTIIQSWDGSSYAYVVGDPIIVKLDTIEQISNLRTEPIYETNNDRNSHKPSTTYTKLANIYTSTLHGHGMNGISTNITIDEASYNRLIDIISPNVIS